jgi:two-component sensor histidine kinase
MGIDRQIGLELRSILSVPLQVKQGVIGALQIVDSQAGRFTTDDLTLVESLASAAAVAIENARLYEAAQELHRQTQRDAETRAMLLREVNHRVKNNLTAILGLLAIERRQTASGQSPACRALVDNLAIRIKSLAQVHSLLSAIEWQPLPLSDLARQIILTALQSMPGGEAVAVSVTQSWAQVTPDQAHNLAMIINELTTNTLKHAVQEQGRTQITVRITSHDELIQCEFRDDGPGYPPEVLGLEYRNVGLYLIRNLVHKGLRGDLTLRNDGGAVALIQFKTGVR